MSKIRNKASKFLLTFAFKEVMGSKIMLETYAYSLFVGLVGTIFVKSIDFILFLALGVIVLGCFFTIIFALSKDCKTAFAEHMKTET